MGARALRNDSATVERIVLDYWDFACARAGWHARGCCPDGDRAAVLSDGLLGLLDAARSYDAARGELRPYVRSLVDFTIVDGYRERLGRTGGRRTVALPADVKLAFVEDGFAAVEDDTEAVLASLWCHLQALTATERAVMVAMYAEGKTQTRVAAERGVTVSAVCIVRRRAVGKLRRYMAKEDPSKWPLAASRPQRLSWTMPR